MTGRGGQAGRPEAAACPDNFNLHPFPSGPADNISTSVTFEEQGKKTQIHARQAFQVMTPEIEHATEGAKQGWTMTLDQLAAFVKDGV